MELLQLKDTTHFLRDFPPGKTPQVIPGGLGSFSLRRSRLLLPDSDDPTALVDLYCCILKSGN